MLEQESKPAPAVRRRRKSLRQQTNKFIVFIIALVVGYAWKVSVAYFPEYDVGYVVFAIFAFLYGAAATMASVSALYGFSSEPVDNVVAGVALSVVACIAGFAALYEFCSVTYPMDAFSVARPLSHAEALYFSIVTFATVGYGDIAPGTDAMKLMVSSEIVISLIYSVLIFSVIAGFIRQGEPRTTGAPDSGSRAGDGLG